jgi:cell division protein FtsI (penicillin-binding protein 3)
LEASLKKRITLLLVGVLVLAGGIVARLFHVQVVRYDQLRDRAGQQHSREIVVPATRGAILDREGRELALSLQTESLFAHPRRVRDPEGSARLLAPVLGLSQREVLGRLRSDKPFVYLDRFLDPERRAAVRRLDLPIGDTEPFGFLPSSKRYYPRGRLGVHVLGFANVDGVGVEGIERQFDHELSGDPTVYLVLQDGLSGRVRQKTIDAPDKRPRDVILSIDAVLQYIVERELDQTMRDTRAQAATAMLADPVTGEVLALANRPAADPNAYGQATDAARINRAVVHQYEPGSTFKIVTMAAALERGRVTPEQWFDCEQGSYSYRGRRIRDISRNGMLSALEVFEKSSNVGMVKVVQRLPASELRETIVDFGFASRTGIELPGEAEGFLRPLADWSGQTQTSLAFGYEIGVTAAQLASALCVIANDGVRVPLRVVLGLRDSGGRGHRYASPEARRVISSRTARQLTAMMEGVVLRGTGTQARIAGYRLAGKSGTTHKIADGKYSDTLYVSSFGGFAPITSPRLVGLVVIDSPRGHYYGGQVAAPTFRRIMEQALAHVRASQDDDASLAELVRKPAPGESGRAVR